jgi:DNA-binding transcriptional LysR family regulator
VLSCFEKSNAFGPLELYSRSEGLCLPGEDSFGDELLIRTGRSYKRTVRGEWLLRELENLLPRLEALVRGEPFDQSRERLRMAVTDNGSIVLLPALTQRIRTAEPDTTLEVVAWHDRTFEDMEAGKIDLALSPLAALVAVGNRDALQGGLRLLGRSRS